MGEISNLAMDIAASLWTKPATFNELYGREIESLKNSSEFMFDRIVKIAQSKGWIYLQRRYILHLQENGQKRTEPSRL